MIQDVVVLDKVVVVRELLDLLQKCGHHGFPVVHPPESRRFFGIISRDLILQLLWHGSDSRIFRSKSITSAVHDVEVVAYDKTLTFTGSAVPTVENLQARLCQEDLAACLDLEPYVNTSAFAVPERFTLRRAYTLFRSMGLRHLPVVDSESNVIGIVTRSDFLLEMR